ncbi:MAG: DUF3080 family protein [Gammaproteobacteria bacterium]|nr:DUF3080 family protein [Gammaproteobacteria bacterium]
MSGWIRASLAAAVLLSSACQPGTPAAPFEDYLARVARLTGQEAAVADPSSGPAYPQRRALELDIPRRTIDVGEFFELHGCDMGALVGYRNSPLGRTQGASQRLGYEAAWLAAVDACGADAADWLADMGAEKRRRLPALFWNATFAAAEMRTALGGAAAPPDGDLADLVRGLNDSYDRVLQGGFDLGTFERLLERLEAVRPPAFDAWYDRVLAPARPGSEWRRTQRAVVAHAEAWQRLFARCAIDPAAGLGQD